MRRGKAVRVAGFVGALGVSAALVGFAATGTGAYFTDSKSGEVDAGTGHVKLDIGPGDGKLSFDNLLPGDYKSQQLSYAAHGTGAEDVWLVFPTGTPNPSEAFTGYSGDAGGGGLGRYGHFALSSAAGSFTSYNLNGRNPSDSASPFCATDANGHGGSDTQAANKTDPPPPYCVVPNAILLDSNLTDGQTGSATLTFGYTPLLTGPQDAPLNKVVSFKVVATQHGIRPDNPNNPVS
jgi:hypothetical protein